MRVTHLISAALAFLAIPGAALAAPEKVTPPASFFAQPPGSDYYLANYTEYEAYLKKLATESDRAKLIDIGQTTEGRTQWVMIVSSPANLARLEEYRLIARDLAKAKGVDEARARELAEKGKAIVWIDAGLHANEPVTSQGQIQVLYRMLSQTDPETMRMLDDCIILFAHDNPDGMELVSNWYMRNPDPRKREYISLPRLYQKYAGHDNNRDGFMVALKETENLNRTLFRTWYPQIVYNQHQPGPQGMVVFIPPFRDPFNYNFDPMVMSGLNEVGFAMHSRLIEEGKGGSGSRSSATYSNWYNGGVRTVSYFHNVIGILTEIIGGPTPTKIPLAPSTQLPRSDELMPIAPRDWHLQDSLDYQWTLNRAVIDYASRNRSRLLFNIWRMGMNSIEKGSRDSWTVSPTKIDRLANSAPAPADPSDPFAKFWNLGPKKVDVGLYKSILQKPEERDPRAYVIPSDQPDLPTAVTFLNTLVKNGVDIERAEAPFTAGGRTWPAGSFLVRTAQAYRPHILDMFEPQDHPMDLEYPGGPPARPYDVTGYTLAYQMGIRFDRLFEDVKGRFAALPDLIATPAGRLAGQGGAGWIVSHEANNSFILTNRLLKAGAQVEWMNDSIKAGGRSLPPGALWIPASGKSRAIVERAVTELGLTAFSSGSRPAGRATPLRSLRLGLVDRFGGLQPAGWTRLILEKFEFDFTDVYPKRLDAGDLKKDFDVLLFVDGAIPGKGAWSGSDFELDQPAAAEVPEEWRSHLGLVSEQKTIPAIKAFAEQGGSVVAIGSSTRLIELLGTQLKPALSRQVDGQSRRLDSKDFYIPGSILQARVDPHHPLGYGMPATADVFYNQSQTFIPAPGATGIGQVAWFDTRTVLRSGWAVGQEKLAGTAAIAEVPVGRGRLVVMAPEVAQRAQPHGTFKFLFNALQEPVGSIGR